MGENHLRRPFVDDATVIEHHDALGRLGDVFHGVRDHDNRGAALVQGAHDVEHLATAAGVQAHHGLVKHEYLGVHGDDAGKRHTALLTARQVEGRLLRHSVVIQTHKRDGPAHGLVHLGLVHAQVARAKAHVLAHGLGKELVLGVLGDEAHQAAHLTASLSVGRRETVHRHGTR